MTGIILKAISGFYYVESASVLYECRARGAFRREALSPKVGDTVTFTPDGNKGVVEAITPRKSNLDRPSVANIDKLFIVSCYTTPAPNPLLIDRMTALAVYHGIEPVIVFNKCDLGDFSSVADIYRHAGFKTLVVSAKSGEGINELLPLLFDCVSAFTGNSGVGKSSLLNTLFPTLSLATGEVSEKLGRGRHTTREVQLFSHPYHGYVADTPGFSTLENDADLLGFKECLCECFPDFTPFTAGCRFTGCSHTSEKGCRVCEAVKNGEIEKSRHDSFVTLYDELKDVRDWKLKK